MALKRIKLEVEVVTVRPDAERLVRDAEERIERFVYRRRDDPVPAFVPSDFRLSYATLELLRDRHLAPEMTFCEWGSGFGVTACLASQLGFEACGIEVERDLVDESRALAEAHDLTTEFVHGSFIPEDGNDLAVEGGEFSSLTSDVESGYDELGLGVEDFGVVYAYPWPGDEPAFEAIFDAYAATGALLVTYRGLNHIHVHRKVRR